MDLMADTYKTLFGQKDINHMGVVTGKSIIAGGINGRGESTGLGVYYCIRNILCNDEYVQLRRRNGLIPGLEGKKIIVQGFGAVGYWAAKFLQNDGAIIVGVQEFNGCVYNPTGIDIEDLKAYMSKGQGVIGHKDHVYSQSILDRPCDVLIPAAMEKALNKYNCEMISAKIIAEGGNGVSTLAADQHFDSQGIVVIPDILCNAAGVTCSYLEWLKNLEHKQPGRLNTKWQESSKKKFFKEIEKACQVQGMDIDLSNLSQESVKGPSDLDLVYTGLDKIMSVALRQVVKTSDDLDVSLRTAVYINTIKRIYKSYLSSGLTLK